MNKGRMPGSCLSPYCILIIKRFRCFDLGIVLFHLIVSIHCNHYFIAFSCCLNSNTANVYMFVATVTLNNIILWTMDLICNHRPSRSNIHLLKWGTPVNVLPCIGVFPRRVWCRGLTTCVVVINCKQSSMGWHRRNQNYFQIWVIEMQIIQSFLWVTYYTMDQKLR